MRRNISTSKVEIFLVGNGSIYKWFWLVLERSQTMIANGLNWFSYDIITNDRNIYESVGQKDEGRCWGLEMGVQNQQAS